MDNSDLVRAEAGVGVVDDADSFAEFGRLEFDEPLRARTIAFDPATRDFGPSWVFERVSVERVTRPPLPAM